MQRAKKRREESCAELSRKTPEALMEERWLPEVAWRDPTGRKETLMGGPLGKVGLEIVEGVAVGENWPCHLGTRPCHLGTRLGDCADVHVLGVGFAFLLRLYWVRDVGQPASAVLRNPAVMGSTCMDSWGGPRGNASSVSPEDSRCG